MYIRTMPLLSQYAVTGTANSTKLSKSNYGTLIIASKKNARRWTDPITLLTGRTNSWHRDQSDSASLDVKQKRLVSKSKDTHLVELSAMA